MSPEIQRFLDSCGQTLTGKPRYKVVWSDDETELRISTFNEFSGDIFLRTFTGAKRVPKYPYVSSRWILEKFLPPEVAYSNSLPESSQGSYEPLFVFQDKDGNALPVVLPVLEIIVAFDRRGPRRMAEILAEDERLQELADRREFAELFDSIDITPLQSLLHSKEAIIKP